MDNNNSMISNYEEARYKCIIRPQPAKLNCGFDRWVTIDSDLWQREPIVQIRRYQGIECKDGFNWDTSDVGWEDTAVYTFVDYLMVEAEDTEAQEHLYGAVGFHAPKESNIAILDFCWIHPFWRNQGKLKNAWSDFIERFDSFVVNSPNRNMRYFLKAINWDN